MCNEITTIEALQTKIDYDEEFDGCATRLSSGRIIGTTSGCYQPVLYRNDDDQIGQTITWEEALKIYVEDERG